MALERRTSRGGRDSIDHPPSGHDDIANAIAGLAYVAINRYVAPMPTFGVWASTMEQNSSYIAQVWEESARRIAAMK